MIEHGVHDADLYPGDSASVQLRAEYEYERGWLATFSEPGRDSQAVIRKVWIKRPHANWKGYDLIPLQEDGWAILEALGLDKDLEREILAKWEGER